MSKEIKPMRILFLSQWFDPEPGAKGLVFTRELVKQGFEVEVLTGFPNYPGGKLYPGYKLKMLQREVIDGVHITRVPLCPNHDRSAIKRVLNYASFAASALFYGLFMVKKADVMYAYHPPLTVGVTAGLIRWVRGIPVVYDVQDMWPDTLRATGMLNNRHALAIVDRVCDWVYRRVDHLVVLSPGFKRLLIERKVPESKIDVIYNWADEVSLMSPVGTLPANFPSGERFKVVFAGNMGKAQALDTVLDAANILQKAGSRVCFVMIGLGLEVGHLKERSRALGLDNVFFLPAVPMAEVGTLLAAADALLVHLRKDPLFEITIPSKTQAYMAVGKPLLMAVNGDAAALVTQSNGGVTAESGNAADLASAAQRLADMPSTELQEMGNRASCYYQEHLAIKVGADKFGVIFTAVINKAKDPRT